MNEEMRATAWARVLAAVRPPHSRNLRQGTWYPVVHDQRQDRVSVVVGTTVVEVPRRVLEIRRQRPDRFSVVYDATSMAAHAGVELGQRYGVCPECRHRFPLAGSLPIVQCPHCGHRGEVGWWD